MASDGSSQAVLEALDAARSVRHAGAGLVVVLLRGSEVAATLHWRADESKAAPMTQMAQSLGAARAVLIVVGSTRVVGRIITACDAAAAELIGAGLVVVACIHVRALADGGINWTDLSGGAVHDGKSPILAGVPARTRRGRLSRVVRSLLRR